MLWLIEVLDVVEVLVVRGKLLRKVKTRTEWLGTYVSVVFF